MCDLVNLSNCVMESNPGGNGWARRLRPKAFVGSLALEAGLVGAMLLWPLLSPAVLPTAAVTPLPPYYAQRPPTPAVADSRNSVPRATDITAILLHPTVGRSHPAAPSSPGDKPPSIGDNSPGDPGVSIPGGNSNGRPIEVPRPPASNRPVTVSAGSWQRSWSIVCSPGTPYCPGDGPIGNGRAASADRDGRHGAGTPGGERQSDPRSRRD